MKSILDVNIENIELLKKTKNLNLTVYRFFPNPRPLTKKEKLRILKTNKKTNKKYKFKPRGKSKKKKKRTI